MGSTTWNPPNFSAWGFPTQLWTVIVPNIPFAPMIANDEFASNLIKWGVEYQHWEDQTMPTYSTTLWELIVFGSGFEVMSHFAVEHMWSFCLFVCLFVCFSLRSIGSLYNKSCPFWMQNFGLWALVQKGLQRRRWDSNGSERMRAVLMMVWGWAVRKRCFCKDLWRFGKL